MYHFAISHVQIKFSINNGLHQIETPKQPRLCPKLLVALRKQKTHIPLITKKLSW